MNDDYQRVGEYLAKSPAVTFYVGPTCMVAYCPACAFEVDSDVMTSESKADLGAQVMTHMLQTHLCEVRGHKWGEWTPRKGPRGPHQRGCLNCAAIETASGRDRYCNRCDFYTNHVSTAHNGLAARGLLLTGSPITSVRWQIACINWSKDQDAPRAMTYRRLGQRASLAEDVRYWPTWAEAVGYVDGRVRS